MDSGAAVSLIHLQAYKLMPDTLKTMITLPGELETLTTADGSPMHIIGHATITLHLRNLRVTHHFIVVESLMTDVILGIDFQREYRISCDWDEEKWCYIRYKGQFLCYTEDMGSGINRVSEAKTIRIPPPPQNTTERSQFPLRDMTSKLFVLFSVTGSLFHDRGTALDRNS